MAKSRIIDLIEGKEQAVVPSDYLMQSNRFYTPPGGEEVNTYDTGLGRSAADLQQKIRNSNQTGLDMGIQASKRLFQIPFSIIGNVASALDFEDYMNQDDEVGNWLTNAMESIKTDIKESAPIYRAEPGKPLDIGDPAWWWDNGSSLVESATSFVATGYLTGAGIGMLGKAANSVKWLNSLNNTTKAVEGAKWLANSAALNQAESIGIATNVYNDVYNEKLQEGLSPEAAKMAAATAASTSIDLNRINILLNITSAKAFVRPPTLTRQLLTKSTGKRALGEMGKEGFQEMGEETVNMIAENKARAEAAGKKYGWSEALSDVLTKQGAENALLGFVGGAGQTALTHFSKSIPAHRTDEGKLVSSNFLNNQRYDEQQKVIAQQNTIANVSGFKGLTDAFTSAEEQQNLLANVNAVAATGNKEAFQKATDNLLIYQAQRAFESGTTENLLDVYQKLGSFTDEQYEAQGLDPQFAKQKAAEAVSTIKELESQFIEASNYQNSSQVYTTAANILLQEKLLNEYQDKLNGATSKLSSRIESGIKAGKYTTRSGASETIQEAGTNNTLTREKILSYNAEDILSGNNPNEGKAAATYNKTANYLRNTKEYRDAKDIKDKTDSLAQSIEDLKNEYDEITSDEFQQKLSKQTEFAEKVNEIENKNPKKDSKYKEEIENAIQEADLPEEVTQPVKQNAQQAVKQTQVQSKAEVAEQEIEKPVAVNELFGFDESDFMAGLKKQAKESGEVTNLDDVFGEPIPVEQQMQEAAAKQAEIAKVINPDATDEFTEKSITEQSADDDSSKNPFQDASRLMFLNIPYTRTADEITDGTDKVDYTYNINPDNLLPGTKIYVQLAPHPDEASRIDDEKRPYQTKYMEVRTVDGDVLIGGLTNESHYEVSDKVKYTNSNKTWSREVPISPAEAQEQLDILNNFRQQVFETGKVETTIEFKGYGQFNTSRGKKPQASVAKYQPTASIAYVGSEGRLFDGNELHPLFKDGKVINAPKIASENHIGQTYSILQVRGNEHVAVPVWHKKLSETPVGQRIVDNITRTVERFISLPEKDRNINVLTDHIRQFINWRGDGGNKNKYTKVSYQYNIIPKEGALIISRTDGKPVASKVNYIRLSNDMQVGEDAKKLILGILNEVLAESYTATSAKHMESNKDIKLGDDTWKYKDFVKELVHTNIEGIDVGNGKYAYTVQPYINISMKDVSVSESSLEVNKGAAPTDLKEAISKFKKFRKNQFTIVTFIDGTTDTLSPVANIIDDQGNFGLLSGSEANISIVKSLENPSDGSKVIFKDELKPVETFKTETKVQDVTKKKAALNRLKQADTRLSLFLENQTDTWNIEKLAKGLSDRFSIHVEFVFDSGKWSGKFENGVVYLNKRYLNSTSVFHEFAHPLIETLKNNNSSAYSDLKSQINGTKEGREILKDVKEKYKNLSAEEQMEEAIVETIARYSSGKLNTATPSFINSLIRFIKKMLGLIETVLIKENNSFKEKLVYHNQLALDYLKLPKSLTLQDVANILVYGGIVNTNYKRKDVFTKAKSFSVKDFDGVFHGVGAYMNNANISTVDKAIDNFIELFKRGNTLQLAAFTGRSKNMLDGTFWLSFHEQHRIDVAFNQDVGSTLDSEKNRIVGKFKNRVIDDKYEQNLNAKYEEVFITAYPGSIKAIYLNTSSKKKFDIQKLINLANFLQVPIIPVNNANELKFIKYDRLAKQIYTPRETSKYSSAGQVKYSYFLNDGTRLSPKVLPEEDVQIQTAQREANDPDYIEGLTADKVNDTVYFIINKFAQGLESGKGTPLQILDSIHNDIRDEIDTFEDLKNDPEYADELDRIEQHLNNLKIVSENWSKIGKISKKRFEKLSKFRDDKDAYENDDDIVDEIWDKASFEKDDKIRIGTELRLFLSGILDLNTDGSKRYNFLSQDKYIHWESAYNMLKDILVDAPHDLKKISEILEAEVQNRPWVQEVVNKLKTADPKTIIQFVSRMPGHALKMVYAGYSDSKKGTVLRVMKTNTSSAKDAVFNNWTRQMYNSLYTVDNTTGEYLFDKDKAQGLIEEFKSWGELDPQTVRTWLENVGITFNDVAWSNLVKNGYRHNKQKVSWKDLGDNKKLQANSPSFLVQIANGLNRASAENIINDETDDVTNKDTPITDSVISKTLAKIEAATSTEVRPNSFREGEKQLYTYILEQKTTDRLNWLKQDAENLLNKKDPEYFVLQQLLATEFSKGSSWLKALTADTEAGKHFRSVFDIDHLSLSALKELGKKYSDDRKIQSLDDSEHELVKVALFQDTKQGVSKYGRTIKTFFPTLSDKSQMILIQTIAEDFGTNDSKYIDEEGNINDDGWKHLYSLLVKPEVDRIFQFNQFGKQINIAGYKDGANKFIMFPEFNEIEINGTKVTELLDTSGEETPAKIFEEVEAALTTRLKSIVNFIVRDKVEDWKELGIDEKLDSQYTSKLVGEKIKTAAQDYVVNYLISNAESFKVFVGDPAQYWKKNYFGTDTNITKRLAANIAPGTKLADSDSETFTQVFLDDTKMSSKALAELKELFAGDADVYGAIEGTDGQEYTTVLEELYVAYKNGEVSKGFYDLISKTISDEIKKGNHYYMPELKQAVKDTAVAEEFDDWVLQPRKPVYTGDYFQNGDHPVMRDMYIKSSSFALNPNLTAGKEIDKIRIAMEKLESRKLLFKDGSIVGGTVRASFKSANKVGAPEVNLPVMNNEGNFMEYDVDILDAHALTLDRRNFKIQQEVPFKGEKEEINRGTQESKTIFTNLLNVDGFKWNGKKVKGFALYREYETRMSKLFDIQSQNLLEELGQESYDEIAKTLSPDNTDITKKKELLQKIVDILREEADSRDYPKKDVLALSVTDDGELALPLWLSASHHRYENLLTAIVRNRVLKIAMPGSPFVLGSEEGFKTKVSETIPEDDSIVYTDKWEGYLKPAIQNGGFAQVLVPSRFKQNGRLIDMRKFAKKVDGKYILDNDKLDPSLLKIFGFRIPTSGLMSMSGIEIVGFLPEESGDLVIAPRDFTKQMGSDNP